MSAAQMEDIGYTDHLGVRLRADPARDACFKVVRSDAELHEYEGTSEIARRELVHRHMSNEITSLDIAADCIAAFPDTAWELQMELARQCWDEARHIALLHKRLQELGGFKGEFPIATFEWTVTCAIDNLIGRLASQNRTFEGGAMDVVGNLIAELRKVGDKGTADILEGILADEIQHVRFGNRWIRRYAEEDRRSLLKVVMAIRFVDHVNTVLQPAAGERNEVGKVFDAAEERVPIVNIEDRRLAEFTDDEINEILRQAGFRALVTAQEATHP